MPGTLEQIRSGEVRIENCDPRFAELDAQILAGETARQGRPDVVGKAKPHRPVDTENPVRIENGVDLTF
jgi:hypothetical protein